MHELLFSGLPPVGQSVGSKFSWNGNSSFRDRWLTLADSAIEVNVCVGYTSNDAIAELQSILSTAPADYKFHLTLGMAKFEGLTRAQFSSLKHLQSMFKERNIGSVNVVNSWPFHGKVSVFSDRSNVKRAIVGSSNFSGIVRGEFRYECDVEIVDENSVNKLTQFTNEIRTLASRELDDSVKIVSQSSSALDNFLDVEVVDGNELVKIKSQASEIVYEMPLKVGDDVQKSNLNVFFGTGRVNGQRSLIIPRPWYEVELQPGRDWYRSCDKFPKAEDHFRVVTDDGYTFDVYSSYDRSWDGQKNFRSSGDLQILGRWIKGRLEAEGALQPGTRVTDETLQKYGRDSITFKKIGDQLWYMDFSQ